MLTYSTTQQKHQRITIKHILSLLFAFLCQTTIASENNIPINERFISDKNTLSSGSPSIAKIIHISTRMMLKSTDKSVPKKSIPMRKLTNTLLSLLSEDTVHIVKLGHSSLLIKWYGKYWLIDPVFSKYASPFSFAGPKRFHPTPIALEELPPIERVFISHDHYDHLDKATIKKLSLGNTQFMVPQGVDNHLKRWGVDEESIHTFAWWQELTLEEALIAFTPTQHFSGRGLLDRNESLWGSWVIKTTHASLFFSGDTGYFEGFKAIGKKYGPFDLTFIETGAYDSSWATKHLFPEQSVQVHIDLKGKAMLPIHNSTFDLAFHPWQEPLERVKKAAKKNHVQLITPIIGEILSLNQLPITSSTASWWEAF